MSQALDTHARPLQGVLRTMETVRAKLKPGIAYPDMHCLADRCNLEALVGQVCAHTSVTKGHLLGTSVLLGGAESVLI